MQLLRTYIRALVDEAINRPGGPGQKKPERFELNAFKALPRLPDMIKYADERLEVLGMGTARTVFRLNGTRVLKLANTTSKGCGQNQAEVDVASDPACASVVTKIFAHDPQFKWVISEIVRPMASKEEFQELTNIPWDEFQDHIKPYGATMSYWEPEGEEKQFIDSVRAVVTMKQLEWADVAVFKHWGKSPDGRVVLLDYGYTSTVRDTHYGPGHVQRDKQEKVDWNAPVSDAQEMGVRPGGPRPPAGKVAPKTLHQ